MQEEPLGKERRDIIVNLLNKVGKNFSIPEICFYISVCLLATFKLGHFRYTFQDIQILFCQVKSQRSMLTKY